MLKKLNCIALEKGLPEYGDFPLIYNQYKNLWYQGLYKFNFLFCWEYYDSQYYFKGFSKKEVNVWASRTSNSIELENVLPEQSDLKLIHNLYKYLF